MGSIKQQLASYFLKKKQQAVKRNRRFHNSASAKCVGIVWMDGTNGAREAARQLTGYFCEKNIVVKTLSYHPLVSDELKENDSIVSAKDFNWLKQPKSPHVKAFLQHPKDILISLCTEENLAMQHIIALDCADMKMGCATDGHDFMDVSIDVNQQPDPLFLAGQIKHYLEMINR